MGNPRCQRDRALAGYRTNDFLDRIDISRLLRLLRYPSGRAIARGASADEGRTAPTRMRRVRRRSIVKAAALYTLGLAPGFNIDSRDRQA
jgi:hypothetical protein